MLFIRRLTGLASIVGFLVVGGTAFAQTALVDIKIQNNSDSSRAFVSSTCSGTQVAPTKDPLAANDSDIAACFPPVPGGGSVSYTDCTVTYVVNTAFPSGSLITILVSAGSKCTATVLGSNPSPIDAHLLQITLTN